MYQISHLFELTPTIKRKELVKELAVSRSTLWRYVNDPMAMPLSIAIQVAEFYDLDNPRDLVQPLKEQA